MSFILKMSVCLQLIAYIISFPVFSNEADNDECYILFSKVSYDEVKDFIQALEIKDKKKYFDLITSKDWPWHFPRNPHIFFVNWDWEDLGITELGLKKDRDELRYDIAKVLEKERRRKYGGDSDLDEILQILTEAEKSGVYYLQTEGLAPFSGQLKRRLPYQRKKADERRELLEDTIWKGNAEEDWVLVFDRQFLLDHSTDEVALQEEQLVNQDEDLGITELESQKGRDELPEVLEKETRRNYGRDSNSDEVTSQKNPKNILLKLWIMLKKWTYFKR